MFGPDGREKWGGGVGSRKGLGKRGPRGAVRQEFLLLGPRQLPAVVGTAAAAGEPSDG